MQETYIESLNKILSNKERIEDELKVKITNKGKLIFVDGAGENEYLALKVIEALNLGFTIDNALELKNEEIILHIVNIKNVTKRSDIERIRARLIGTHGKTIHTMEGLTDCEIAVHDNKVGIIGSSDCMNEAIISVELIIRGSKQGNVYARLEKKKKARRINPQTIRKSDLK